MTYGPEVLFAYLYARETEIKNIRMILISKLNSTDTNSIRERLRETYV
ncbi:V-type ATP synthase, subunit C [Peptoniphilus indolicus ATCC 29427]|uniref:V-type ATP synthase, subunit C n=1 Tax=Peptoniphilus indolicus ATCC 29427 TaxID=997350 RepID=G4D1B6_9FIRM|nr:V-type ATPase subunit [Peptoniphilus indolicus]EGY80657.1 V-type ATP synthase, subunit C [Peptoniphilus indolicus ATCC 29427]